MDAETNKVLRAIVLLDGRPGHEKQTMGIIQALQKRVSVQIIRIKVGRFSLINSFVQTCRLYLPFLPTAPRDDLSQSQIDETDLLIGTGSRTHLPLLLYKRKYGMPAFTCMMPPVHLRNRFDLCFVPEHDGKSEGGNIMLTVGAPNSSQNKRKHQDDCGLILLGGVDTKSHVWDSKKVVKMVEKIATTNSHKTWTVSSSPRTPVDTVALVELLSQKHPNIHFFDYSQTPSGWIEQQYDQSSVVWVTADSISMIYEALTAGCRVGIFPMQWIRKNSKFRRNENILVEKKLVTTFVAWEQGNMHKGEEIELNEAQRCADRILQKLQPVTSQ